MLLITVPVSHPQNVNTNRINETSALVTWMPLSLTEARGFITHYNITYWNVSSDISDSESIILPGDENSTIISGLDPDSQYSFIVSAGTVVGESNFSEPIILSKYTTVDQGNLLSYRLLSMANLYSIQKLQYSLYTETLITGVTVVLAVAVVVLILGVFICIGCMYVWLCIYDK